MFGWVEKKENKMWGPGVFSLGTPKCFLPKMERKLSGDEFFLIDKNVHVYVHNFFKLPLFLFTKKKKVAFIFFCLLPWAVTLLCFSLATLPLFLFLFFIFLFFFFWLSPGRPFFFFFFPDNIALFFWVVTLPLLFFFFLFLFFFFFFWFSRAWRDSFFFFF